MNITYVTGNPDKARLFNKMVGIDIPHEGIDIDEVQSLNLLEVVEHKAKAAFAIVNKPVIVEDTKLVFHALGLLPGPFIKWFSQEVGDEGLCRLLDAFDDRSATAGCAIAYYDGSELVTFERENTGRIASKPSKGKTGFGWDTIYIPDGQDLTRAEMDDETYRHYYGLTKPFDELADFLRTEVGV